MFFEIKTDLWNEIFLVIFDRGKKDIWRQQEKEFKNCLVKASDHLKLAIDFRSQNNWSITSKNVSRKLEVMKIVRAERRTDECIEKVRKKVKVDNSISLRALSRQLEISAERILRNDLLLTSYKRAKGHRLNEDEKFTRKEVCIDLIKSFKSACLIQ
jgi:hypothetical protein